MEFVRLFVAVRPPGQVLSALAEIQTELAEAVGGDTVRWVNQATMHVTLHFLGETARDRVSVAAGAVKRAADERCVAAGPSPIALGADGLGAFPSAIRPRVVWAGVRDDTGALEHLHRLAGTLLADAGFRMDHRPFRPHITLGYVRRRAARETLGGLSSALVAAGHAAPEWTPTFLVTEMSLVRSTLTPAGPVYHDVYSAVL